MSALTTQIVTNSEKGEKKENEPKSQTSNQNPKRDHLREQSLSSLRQGQRLNTTKTKCSKMLTPQGEAKGLDTVGKRAKHKANLVTKSSQSKNVSSA
jgi:hypothetical protein